MKIPCYQLIESSFPCLGFFAELVVIHFIEVVVKIEQLHLQIVYGFDFIVPLAMKHQIRNQRYDFVIVYFENDRYGLIKIVLFGR